MFGQEQTKLIGSFRLHVPADNKFAVKAGIAAFGERKFYDQFCYNVPALNNYMKPTGSNGVHSEQLWDYIVADPKDKKSMPLIPSQWPPKRPYIYRITANLSGINPRLGNASPLTLYSMLPGGPNRPPGGPKEKLIGSRWNLFGVYQDYYPIEDKDKSQIKLTIGNLDNPMANDMRTILGKRPKPIAVRVFQTPPVAIENRAYYVPKA